MASWNNVSTDWNNGLVIQDNYGNQFVWVPIDGNNVAYAKWCTKGYSYIDTADDKFSNESDELNEVTLENKYHGFYIGRYEISFDYNNGDLRIMSKKSTNVDSSDWSGTRDNAHTGYLWNYIDYTDSKNYTENMDTDYGYDTSKIGTNLVTGTEWDTTMKWIESKKSLDYVDTDSSNWGNYYSASFAYDYPTNGTKSVNISVLLNTGATSRNSESNIYDLAGNLWEWTNEKYSTNFVSRGGYYGSAGVTCPATFRFLFSSNAVYQYLGARVALYIK